LTHFTCEDNLLTEICIYLPYNIIEFNCVSNKLEILPIALHPIKYICHDNPIYDRVCNIYGDIQNYMIIRQSYYKNMCNKIGNWYLECKYNPKYEQCRKKLKLEYEELYGISV